MPWEEKTVEKSRIAFLADALQGEQTMSELCRIYGISRKTGYKWLHRYECGESMGDHSRAPFGRPNKTQDAMEQLILAHRDNRPAWGARKLKHSLERKGYRELPAASTICAILKRNGRINQEESKKHKPYTRFERAYPNDLWQTDFKGDFALGNGQRCHPLTVLDDHSRYSLCVDAKENERYNGVRESFIRLFKEYGLPKSILCDNGNPWGTSQSAGYTRFEVWLMDLGILTIHGRPMHPQTQGKEERFHRTLKAELLRNTTLKHMAEAQKNFDRFRTCYNEERPHQALGYDVPAKHYSTSSRVMPKRIKTWDYPCGCMLRKVKASGYITFMNQGYFLSEAFAEKEIGVQESDESNTYDLLYRGFRIGKLNAEERIITSRRVYR